MPKFSAKQFKTKNPRIQSQAVITYVNYPSLTEGDFPAGKLSGTRVRVKIFPT